MIVKDIPVVSVIEQDRRREDYGDLEALAAGIQRVGLLEPIIVDRAAAGYRLVAGGRRLRAVRDYLRREFIAASLLDTLTEEELRDYELEENENRKQLTSYEASRRMVLKAEKAAESFSVTATKKDPRGRKPKHQTSRETKAAAAGVSEPSYRRAEEQVSLAERFPFMQGSGWRQSDVLRVGEHLAAVPEAEHDDVAGVFACARLLDPQVTVDIVDTLAAMKPAERQEVYGLSRSPDARERSLALTRAAKRPPMPDPRISIIAEVIRLLQKTIRTFPADHLTPRLGAIISELREIQQKISAKGQNRVASIQ